MGRRASPSVPRDQGMSPVNHKAGRGQSADRCVRQPPQEGAVHREAVVPRQQQSVVLSMLVRSEWTHVATTFDLHHCILHRQPGAVQHTTFDP